MEIAPVSNSFVYDPHKPTYIENVPDELFCKLIFPFASASDLKNLPLVCKRWHALLGDNFTKKNIIKTYFPNINFSPADNKKIQDCYRCILKMSAIFKNAAPFQKELNKCIEIKCLQFKQEGPIFLNKKKDEIQTLSVSSLDKVDSFNLKGAENLCFHLYSKNIYLGNREGVIHSFEIGNKNTRVKRLYTSFKDAAIEHITVNEDCIYFVHHDEKQVRRYLRFEGYELDPLGQQESALIGFDLDSEHLYIGYANRVLEAYRKGDGAFISRLELHCPITCLKVSGERRLFIGHQDGAISLLNFKTDTHIRMECLTGTVYSIDVYKTWMFIGGGAGNKGYIACFDLESKQLLSEQKFSSPVAHIAFNYPRLFINFKDAGLIFIDYEKKMMPAESPGSTPKQRSSIIKQWYNTAKQKFR